MYNNKDLLIEHKEPFAAGFNNWRIKRVEKLVSIFGLEWFKGKKILEMGCSYGNIGLYLESLGSTVHFCDAREEVLQYVNVKKPSAITFVLDQERDWLLQDHYDLIIHFGILYNLNYWEKDLVNVFRHSNYVALESAVNKFDNTNEYKILDYNYDHEFHGPARQIGTLTSSVNIEEVVRRNNFTSTRYDDSDLNCPEVSRFVYDWKEVDGHGLPSHGIVNSWWNNPFCEGRRRFWILSRNNMEQV